MFNRKGGKNSKFATSLCWYVVARQVMLYGNKNEMIEGNFGNKNFRQIFISCLGWKLLMWGPLFFFIPTFTFFYFHLISKQIKIFWLPIFIQSKCFHSSFHSFQTKVILLPRLWLQKVNRGKVFLIKW